MSRLSRTADLANLHGFQPEPGQITAKSWVNYIDRRLDEAVTASYPEGITESTANSTKDDREKKAGNIDRFVWKDTKLASHWKPEHEEVTKEFLGRKFNSQKHQRKKLSKDPATRTATSTPQHHKRRRGARSPSSDKSDARENLPRRPRIKRERDEESVRSPSSDKSDARKNLPRRVKREGDEESVRELAIDVGRMSTEASSGTRPIMFSAMVIQRNGQPAEYTTFLEVHPEDELKDVVKKDDALEIGHIEQLGFIGWGVGSSAPEVLNNKIAVQLLALKVPQGARYLIHAELWIFDVKAISYSQAMRLVRSLPHPNVNRQTHQESVREKASTDDTPDANDRPSNTLNVTEPCGVQPTIETGPPDDTTDHEMSDAPFNKPESNQSQPGERTPSQSVKRTPPQSREPTPSQPDNSSAQNGTGSTHIPGGSANQPIEVEDGNPDQIVTYDRSTDRTVDSPPSDYETDMDMLTKLGAYNDDKYDGGVDDNFLDGDGDDDDSDPIQQWDERLKTLTENLPVCSQLTDENIKAYCEWRGGAPAHEWNPQDPVRVPGMKIDLKEYQLFTIWWMLRHAGQFTSNAGNTLQRLGSTLAHEPGLGKTPCVIGYTVLNCILRTRHSQVNEDQKTPGTHQHLPSDASNDQHCPNQDGWPFRCPCENRDKTLLRGLTSGAFVITAPISVVWKWNSEFAEFVDHDEFQRWTGYPLRVVVGHQKTAQSNNAPTVQDVCKPPLCLPDVTLRMWIDANGGDGARDKVAVALHRGHEATLHQPRVSGGTTSGIVVLTTVHSFKSQVSELTEAVWVPAFSVKIDCDKGTNCTHKAPSKCANQTHAWTTSSKKRVGMVIAGFFLDEVHDQFGNAMVAREIRRYAEDQYATFGSIPFTCPVTGTPMAKNPSDALIVFGATQEIRQAAPWSSVEALAPFTKACVETAVGIDKAVNNARQNNKVTDKTLAAFPAVGPHEIVPNRDNLLALYRDHTTNTVGKFIEDHMIMLKADDSYNNHVLVILPGLRHARHEVRMDRSHRATLAPLVIQYLNTTSDFKEARRSEAGPKKAEHRGLAAAMRHAVRKVMLCLSNPALVPIVTDPNPITSNSILAKTIYENGWWDNPRQSVFYPIRQRMFEDSPKIKYIVGVAKTLPLITTTVSWYAEDGTTQSKDIQHHEKIVLCCFEPVQALCLWIVLRDQLKSELKWSPRSIEVLHAGSKKQEIIERFQLHPSAVSGPNSPPSIDILILCTRTGGVGITLTASHRMFMFDFDPDRGRQTQVPRRCHRIGQKEIVDCVQLVEKSWRIEAIAIEARNDGSNTILNLLNVKNAQGRADKANTGGNEGGVGEKLGEESR